jgi:DNA modification methylase
MIPLRDRTVQCCVTSPPYWAMRSYLPDDDPLKSLELGQEKTPAEYVSALVSVFSEVKRVLKDDGVLWLNLGDCYHSGDRGGYSRSRLGVKRNMGSRASDFLHAPNRLPQEGLKDKDLCEIPSDVARALREDGWYLRSRIPWLKNNPMVESCRDRPSSAVEYIFLLSKSRIYFYDYEAVKLADQGTDHRCNVLRAPEPSGGMMSPHGGVRTREGRNGAGRNRKNSDWFFESLMVDQEGNPLALIANSKAYRGHTASFPRELVEPCIKAGSKLGDTVLDPFCGSGTTVMVAEHLGRRGIGIDLTYQDLASQRIGGSLFKNQVNSAWG